MSGSNCSVLLSVIHKHFYSFLFMCMCVFVVTGFTVPHDKALFTLSPGAHNQHDLSSYSQLSHHAFQRCQLGGISGCHSLKSDSGPVTGGTLWDIENIVQPLGSYSGSPGHQQGGGHAGVTLF